MHAVLVNMSASSFYKRTGLQFSKTLRSTWLHSRCSSNAILLRMLLIHRQDRSITFGRLILLLSLIATTAQQLQCAEMAAQCSTTGIVRRWVGQFWGKIRKEARVGSHETYKLKPFGYIFVALQTLRVLIQLI